MEKFIKMLSIVVLTLILGGCVKQTDMQAEKDNSEIETYSKNTENKPEQSTNQTVANSDEHSEEDTNLSGFNICIGEKKYFAKFCDTSAAKEFAMLLPMTIDMSELNGNEKYYYLDEKFTTDSEVPDMIHTGDIMLYGSNCIVLFYEDFSTSYSYTPIAHIEDTNGLKSALGSGNITISFN